MTDHNTAYENALLEAKREPPDLEAAYKLLQSAASAGDERAVYALATWYLFGNSNVSRDEKRGVEMLLSLKESNIAEAMFDLAVSYDYGRSVEADEKEAFAFYMKAALLGDSQSCKQVSEFYREGSAVSQDDSLCCAWALRADQQEVDISPPYRVWL